MRPTYRFTSPRHLSSCVSLAPQFAKSRGTIHFHALLFKTAGVGDIGALLNQALLAASFAEVVAIEARLAKEIPGVLAGALSPMSALHPAGLRRSQPHTVCATDWYKNRVRAAQHDPTMSPEQLFRIRVGKDDGHLDDPELVGDVDRWPAPEGNLDELTNHPLRHKLYQIFNDYDDEGNLVGDDLVATDRCDLVNRTILHGCSSYCLRSKNQHAPAAPVAAPGAAPGAKPTPVFECKFGFGPQNLAKVTRTDGMPARLVEQLTSDNGIVKLDYVRDHPRIVAAPQDVVQLYRGNTDMQPVLAPSADAPLFGAGAPALNESVWDECLRVLATHEEEVIRGLDNPAHMQNYLRAVRDSCEIRKKRAYFNRATLCEFLINYIVRYHALPLCSRPVVVASMLFSDCLQLRVQRRDQLQGGCRNVFRFVAIPCSRWKHHVCLPRSTLAHESHQSSHRAQCRGRLCLVGGAPVALLETISAHFRQCR